VRRAGVSLRAALFAATALLGFAANSLLCRTALRPGLIDAASFTAVRIAAGALALLALAAPRLRRRGGPWRSGSWGSALALFAYAAAFSYSYLRIGAGTGALLLFGSVQATMLIAGLRAGERLHARSALGTALALLGLVILVLPGLTAPDPIGAALMAAAGVAWGAYSLRGRGATEPLLETAGNFARSVPLALLLLLPALASAHASRRGIALAALSGALASGVGYSLWYAALPSLGALRAAVVQLAVPVLTAAGAVALLGEEVTARLIAASLVILGGVALALLPR
jgi:drug/metabolite transporter (DMT)-like permease